jgi:hypothetical protein
VSNPSAARVASVTNRRFSSLELGRGAVHNDDIIVRRRVRCAPMLNELVGHGLSCIGAGERSVPFHLA